ncbi:hypothetical protein LCGC14_1030260 [marine sediment metagenome]|uniref:Uncharacterized protein n=1 Tax=marine sediment metagenome TaxID=412755 RepID=A0A0F9NGJ5_9ZZZZ
MNTYKLIPQLREGSIIQAKKELLSEFKVGDTIFLISDLPTKKYSIISKIEDIQYTEESEIFIDNRNLGNFGEGDQVFILKYNPAEALEVHVNVSNEHAIITQGDWTSNIKPSLINKLIDYGQEVAFLIPWEGGAPIVATGIINSTLPNPPVYIGDRTKIFIWKSSNEELSKIKREKLLIQEDRVNILERQIKQKTIKLIREIKQKNYPNKGQKYKFKATNPRQLFKSILNVFKGLDSIEDPIEESFDEKEQDYLASAVFLTKQKSDSIQLIDMQIMASGHSGTLIMWVTGENDSIISETLEKYDSRISELQQDLEQKLKILSVQCPECDGNLPIKNIDINGVVECIYCNRISKIPKALRY